MILNAYIYVFLNNSEIIPAFFVITTRTWGVYLTKVVQTYLWLKIYTLETRVTLEQRQRQYSTEEANKTREITKTRWIVQARKGHIKSIFKFLDDITLITHAENIGDFYEIAVAIINKNVERQYIWIVQMLNRLVTFFKRLKNQMYYKRSSKQIQCIPEGLIGIGKMKERRWIFQN